MRSINDEILVRNKVYNLISVNGQRVSSIYIGKENDSAYSFLYRTRKNPDIPILLSIEPDKFISDGEGVALLVGESDVEIRKIRFVPDNSDEQYDSKIYSKLMGKLQEVGL